MTSRPVFPNRPTRALVTRAQLTLGMTHRKFGEALRASERTAARWAAGQAEVTVSQLRTLAALVHPRDAALAAELAAAASETLESLGIVVPVPAPPPAAPAPAPAPPAPARALAPHLVADLVVYAAADAAGVLPAVARAALLAAVAPPRELDLTLEDAEKALAAQAVQPKAPVQVAPARPTPTSEPARAKSTRTP